MPLSGMYWPVGFNGLYICKCLESLVRRRGSKAMIEGIEKLGFPNFFRVELAVLKIIAVLVLLIPQIPVQIKDWAYVGIGLFYLTAFIAHFAHKDPLIINVINIILFGLLIISNICLRKLTGLI